MHVKIAQKLVDGSRGRVVDALDQCMHAVGVDIAWIEIDGVRYDNVLDARVNMTSGACELSLTLLAAVETVLLDTAGDEVKTRRDESGQAVRSPGARGDVWT